MRKMILFSLLVPMLSSVGGAEQQSSRQRHIVFVTGDHEYSSEGTMPAIASELEKRYGFRTTVLRSYPDENEEKSIPGMEALASADLAVLFLRWRQLPAEQVAHIRKYVDSGKPIIGFRTTTHAFNYPKGHELEKWNAFGEEVLGSPPGWGGGHFHYGHRSSTDVTVLPEAAAHPILQGVAKSFHVRSWLYHVLPKYPAPDAVRLLVGRAVDPERENSIDNPVAWTYRTRAGGRVFTTTLGHPEDFQVQAFQRLICNAIHWTLGLDVPRSWRGPMSIRVAYHGIRPTK